MDDGHPPPRYHFDFDFTFDASKFNAVQKVEYGRKC
jgi:hypothetical protein